MQPADSRLVQVTAYPLGHPVSERVLLRALPEEQRGDDRTGRAVRVGRQPDQALADARLLGIAGRQRSLEEGCQRAVGRAGVRRTHDVDAPHAVERRAHPHLVEQPGLADPGGSGDGHRRAGPGTSRVEGLHQLVLLRAATDHPMPLARRQRSPPPDEPMHLHGLRAALDRPLAQVLEGVLTLHEARRRRPDVGLPGRRHRLQPLGQDHRLPQHGVLRAPVGLERPGDDLAGGDPHVQGEAGAGSPSAEGPQLGVHVLGRAECPRRVVLVGDRGTEQGEQGVARELLQIAVVAGDDPRHRRQDRIEDLQQLLGLQPAGQSREAGDVGEQGRDPTPLVERPRPGRGGACGVGAGTSSSSCERDVDGAASWRPHSAQNRADSELIAPQAQTRSSDRPVRSAKGSPRSSAVSWSTPRALSYFLTGLYSADND